MFGLVIIVPFDVVYVWYFVLAVGFGALVGLVLHMGAWLRFIGLIYILFDVLDLDYCVTFEVGYCLRT